MSSIPCLLNKVLDEVGCGAFIKHIDTDEKAIIIDFDVQGFPIVCSYAGGKNTLQECYPIFTILDTKQWIVLTLGQDEHTLDDDEAS